MAPLPTVVVAVAAGVLYGAVWYARNRYRPDEGEAFRPAKFAATLVISAIIGLSAGLAGDPVGFATVETQIVTYVGAISLLEGVLKMVFDRVLA